jgi:flagellar biosynthetic protein FliQ
MGTVEFIDIGRDALWIVLKAAGPLLLAALMIGLTIALFQALTSIQEITLTFVPKILIIFVALIVFLPYMTNTLIEFGQEIYGRIETVG